MIDRRFCPIALQVLPPFFQMLVTSYPHRCHGAHAFFYELLFISRVCDDVRAMPGLEEMEMRGRGGGGGERDVTVTGKVFFFSPQRRRAEFGGGSRIDLEKVR